MTDIRFVDLGTSRPEEAGGQSACVGVPITDLDSTFQQNLKVVSSHQGEDWSPHAYTLAGLQVTLHESNHPRFALTKKCSAAIGNPNTIELEDFASVPIGNQYHPNCRRIEGNWALGSWGAHTTNMYDDFSINAYPLWLAARRFYDGNERVRVSHIDTPPHAVLRFPSLYNAIGEYVNWSEDIAKHTSCVVFDRVVLVESAFFWQLKPVLRNEAYGINQHLQSYVLESLDELAIRSAESSTICEKRILVYARRTRNRKVINDDEFEQSLATFEPSKYTTVISEMEHLPFRDQVELVRNASIYVFPHGAAAFHVLWMKPGAVAIELYPSGWASPMYRNLAVMSGKTFFAYQAKNESAGLSRNSDYHVDTKEIGDILHVANQVMHNNYGDNWGDAVFGRPYNVVIKDSSVEWIC